MRSTSPRCTSPPAAGTLPANRLWLVDMHALTERSADGSVDWAAYDYRTGTCAAPACNAQQARLGCRVVIIYII